jgi:F-type H+-transporting ATPase subunit epsilon
MANTYNLEIVTPSAVLLSESVVELNVPGSEGYLGILSDHMPIVTSLIAGEVRAKYADNRPQARFVIGGGFLQVGAAKTTVLADIAIKVEDIDVAVFEEAVATFKEQLKTLDPGSPQHQDTERHLAFSEAALNSARL